MDAGSGTADAFCWVHGVASQEHMVNGGVTEWNIWSRGLTATVGERKSRNGKKQSESCVKDSRGKV